MIHIKKITLLLTVITFIFLLSSCNPNTIPVEWVDVICSSGEINVGDTVDLTVEFRPANATDQGYTLSIDNTNVVDFTSALQVEGLALGDATVTITSDDGGHTNTCQIYVTGP